MLFQVDLRGQADTQLNPLPGDNAFDRIPQAKNSLKEARMNITRLSLPSLFLAVLATSASGQSVRTFVASTGADSNPCSRVAPCRTFQAAVNAVAPGGEVIALDSAGFGSRLDINKSVSVISPCG